MAKQALRWTPNISMPKNINCSAIIIITLEGSEETKKNRKMKTAKQFE